MSTSYPYFTLSRRLCVRYGDVLKVVDDLDRFGSHLTCDELHLPFDRKFPGGFRDVDAIYDTWVAEQSRRRPLVNAVPFVDDGSTKPFSARDVFIHPGAK